MIYLNKFGMIEVRKDSFKVKALKSKKNKEKQIFSFTM